jgi:hypothetical protein
LSYFNFKLEPGKSGLASMNALISQLMERP